MRMGKFVTWLIIPLVSALFVGLLGFAIWYGNNERQAQLADFKADIIASGFTLLPGKDNPSIEDETSGDSTETMFEALVVVKGCTVELERKYDEPSNAGKRQGRKIELYELDEALRERDEIEINGAPNSPTPDGVAEYLASQGNKFKYCLRA